MAKVFISYSHKQDKWVWDKLVPCLKSGGAEVLVDLDRIEAGKSVKGQMDAIQDQADKHLLVLSGDYLASDYCIHEMERAIASDPDFNKGKVIPTIRYDCTLPDSIKDSDPLYVNLENDKDPAQWTLLLNQCGANLGATAPDWIEARNKIIRFLKRGQSVNLVARGERVWKPLLKHIEHEHIDLNIIDIESGKVNSRPALLKEILRTKGIIGQLKNFPGKPEDLVRFDELFPKQDGLITLTHFDVAAQRKDYGVDLFAAFRNLIMDQRRMVLLVQSRSPFQTLLPRDHPLSEIDIKTVKLHPLA